MSTVQRVAQIFGVVFILVALLGFFLTPGGMTMETSRLLGLFPVNVLHNLFHLLFGIWGLLAARSFTGARTYAQIGGVVYLLLAVVGWVRPDGFGLIPLGSHDIWLHVVLGLGLAAVGFTAKETPARTAAAA